MEKANVVKLRPIVDDEILMKLAEQDVATVHEAMGRRGAMAHSIRPIDRNMKLCGRALTVQCHMGDNLMLIKAASMVQPGDVIVADMGWAVDNGPFGELLGLDCQLRGAAGLVISCGVRDTQALIEMNFPVFSGGISVCGTMKTAAGTINHPIIVGGILINPGDVILGDGDGVVVIPCQEAADILCLAQQRRVKEAEVKRRLYEGISLFELYEYKRVFQKLGITEED